MRVFWNVLKNDLVRTVCSKAFVFAALGLTVATFLTGMDELSYMTPENDLIYIYGIFQYLDFQLLFLLFAAIPGAALFCADWENRFIRFSAQRCSKRIYGVSKGIACFVSAVLVVVVSEWLDLMILRLWGFPAVNMENRIFMALGAFDEIGYSEWVYLYFAAMIFIKACCAGCVCGICAVAFDEDHERIRDAGGADAGVLRFEYTDDVAAYAEQILPRYAL